MNVPNITILGGGPAGLAAGYFARKNGLSFQILEAMPWVGGNAITFEHDGFLFDSGAHRFHDKDPFVTSEIKDLLGDELQQINIPSQIYHRGRWIDFPLSPLNLIKALGLHEFGRAAIAFLGAKTWYRTKSPDGSFESFAVQTYGLDIAERFLLNYSEKLWGLPCSQLSPNISGKRLSNLTLGTFIREAFFGKQVKTTHLDGLFYYPRRGFGSIMQSLARNCGFEYIRTEARVTKILHDESRILAIEVNGNERLPVEHMVSTLPIPLMLHLMNPPPSQKLLRLARHLKFRNMILVVFFLDKPLVTRNGSIYFPDSQFPMTRIYEPRIRSSYMAPPGKTCLVAEIPCQADSTLWRGDDTALVSLIQDHLQRIGLIKVGEVSGTVTKRLPNAYPILKLGVEQIVQQIAEELSGFRNLQFIGRNGMFTYAHVHDMIRFGKDVVDTIVAKRKVEQIEYS